MYFFGTTNGLKLIDLHQLEFFKEAILIKATLVSVQIHLQQGNGRIQIRITLARYGLINPILATL